MTLNRVFRHTRSGRGQLQTSYERFRKSAVHVRMDGGACAVVAGEAGQTTCRKKLTSHVRKIQEEREEAPVQGISEADEAGEEACRGRPRPRRQLQEDRGAAGKVALDRARRGREAPLRLVAEGAGRGACARRGARGCMPQARRMAQMLQLLMFTGK